MCHTYTNFLFYWHRCDLGGNQIASHTKDWRSRALPVTWTMWVPPSRGACPPGDLIMKKCLRSICSKFMFLDRKGKQLKIVGQINKKHADILGVLIGTCVIPWFTKNVPNRGKNRDSKIVQWTEGEYCEPSPPWCHLRLSMEPSPLQWRFSEVPHCGERKYDVWTRALSKCREPGVFF
jgi:hypothetical protein